MTEADPTNDAPADPASGLVRDLFHCCALAAFVAEARAVRGWPAAEPVRRRAYALYEHHLAEERAERTASSASADSCLQRGQTGPCSATSMTLQPGGETEDDDDGDDGRGV